MNDLRRGYELVWEWRAKNGWFPLPDPPSHCFAYAVTEAGEAVDAWLRMQRPDDVRNVNGKAHTVANELADTAFMLYSGLGSDATINWDNFSPTDFFGWTDEQILATIAQHTAGTWWNAAHGDEEVAEHFAITTLCIIWWRLGDMLVPLIEQRLARIEAKRKPAPIP